MDQQWEYCQLCHDYQHSKSQNNVYVFFGEARHDLQISRLSAMAALGRARWELVSVTVVADSYFVSTSAYFKRPIKPGRPIGDAF